MSVKYEVLKRELGTCTFGESVYFNTLKCAEAYVAYVNSLNEAFDEHGVKPKDDFEYGCEYKIIAKPAYDASKDIAHRDNAVPTQDTTVAAVKPADVVAEQGRDTDSEQPRIGLRAATKAAIKAVRRNILEHRPVDKAAHCILNALPHITRANTLLQDCAASSSTTQTVENCFKIAQAAAVDAQDVMHASDGLREALVSLTKAASALGD